jgi:hypothetical protein
MEGRVIEVAETQGAGDGHRVRLIDPEAQCRGEDEADEGSGRDERLDGPPVVRKFQ